MNVFLHRFLLLFIALLSTPLSWANATLFVQEPYGVFGAINPTGHTSVYLSRVCADTPVFLRRCDPGESGVVISRYRKIAGYDWIAIPLVPYLYAVEDLASIPEWVNSEEVASLRDQYRRKHLRQIVPDGPDGRTPRGPWVELVGAAYNRRIYGFEIETTEPQDDYLISALNSWKNKSDFNLFFNNCADFSGRILSLYYPGTIRRSYIADFGITTPQQVVKRLISYAKHHPGFFISTFVLPQITGARRSSKQVRGVLGGVVQSKKYILPLAASHPWIAGSIFAIYLAWGRFNVAQHAKTVYKPSDLFRTQDLSTLAGMSFGSATK